MTPAATVTELVPKSKYHTVEAVRRAEKDSWKIVEAVDEDVADRLDPAALAHARAGTPSGVRTGFYEVCEEIADAIKAEGAEPWQAQTVSFFFKVSTAWPRDDRVEGATYGAHERLARRDDRVKRLTQLVERSSTGKVNRNDVDTWLAGLKPHHVKSFLDGIEHAVRTALRSKGKPWSNVAQGDRDEIASRLRRIAEEVQHSTGKFGR